MVHGDNRGLVMPPMVAPIQTVIVPIIKTAMVSFTITFFHLFGNGKMHPHNTTLLQTPADRDQLLVKAKELGDVLNKASIRVKVDDRVNYSPGWKYNHYELKGVPLRMEIGPNDMQKRSVSITYCFFSFLNAQNLIYF